MPHLSEPVLPEFMTSVRPIDFLLHLLFPDRCLFCRDLLPLSDGLPLCSSCRVKFTPAGRICPCCERFFRGEGSCTCHPVPTPLRSLYALSRYDQQWRLLLHDLKYRKRRSLARPFGVWLAREIVLQKYCVPQLVVPVPLHRHREQERGFNQSALIAGHTARALGIPCRQLLTKNKDTVSQTTISRRERRENVCGAFSCLSPPPQGSVVLLIDDIYSTGATMKEAAAVLQSSGAKVYGAVVSYNPRIN